MKPLSCPSMHEWEKKKVTLILLAKEKSKRQHAPRTDPNICRARSGAHAEFDERERVSVQNENRIRKVADRAADRSNRSFTAWKSQGSAPMHGTASSRRYAYSQGDCVSRSDRRLLRRRHGCWEITVRIASFYFHLLACHTPINGEGAHNGEKMKQWLTYKNLNLRKGYKSIKNTSGGFDSSWGEFLRN
jgi:hypothetical protein